VAAYPITPQTPIYEKLSEMEASGDLGGIMMRMESEHSSMAACIAASLTGARTFTATSSQGLALMHEMLHFASGARTSIVMACVNRTLALPWAFWSDQTDTLSQRDTGWIQIYVEDNQEALDSVIQAFRITEHVMLPCMVVLEANFISHFMEPVEVPGQEAVDRFLPPVSIPQRFDIERPSFVGGVVSQTQYRDFGDFGDDHIHRPHRFKTTSRKGS
jgi:pyruvate/2-oxoacid:ferredoxin oxidoreductase alpha subunit